MSRVDRYVTREVKSRYPLTTSDLAEDEVEALTKILAINNPAPHQVSRPGFPENVNTEIKNAISQVAPILRRSRLVQMMPADVGREAKLCGTHEDLNPYVIAHLYELVQTEVIDRTDTLDRYAEHIQEFDRMILRCVQALRRLWGEAPPDETRQLPINYPHQQGNGCEACTLARIVQDSGSLRNLRIAVLSRTYERRSEKLPRLLCFLHYAIQSHGDFAATMMAESEELASDFMISRKKVSALAHKERRSYEEVEMYLRGQPGRVHPAIREEMFEKEQDHHRRYRHERHHGSHVGHRHAVHCSDSNERPNRHSAHCHKGKRSSQRDTGTDDITPQLQGMSLEEGQHRCEMNCSRRHSHAPPVSRHASSSHAHRNAPTGHRSRHTPAHPGSRRRPSGRQEDDEDALAAQYMHLVTHNAAYGWDTDDDVDIPDDEAGRPTTNWDDFMTDAEGHMQHRRYRRR